MKFNKGKYRFCIWGGVTPSTSNRMGAELLGSTSDENDLRILVDAKLTIHQQSVPVAKMVNCIPRGHHS